VDFLFDWIPFPAWLTVGLLIATFWVQRSPDARAARGNGWIAPAWLAAPALASWLVIAVSDGDGGRWQVMMLAAELALVILIVVRSRSWPMTVWALAAVTLAWSALIGVPVLTREQEVTIGARGEGGVGLGENASISPEFKRPQMGQLLQRLNALAPGGALDEFTCGDPVPHLQFELTLKPERSLRERSVGVVSTPRFADKDRCLNFGLSYSVDVALADIDHGKPIDYGYTHSDGTKAAPWTPGHVGRKPVCQCELRDSGHEWVIWPDPAAEENPQ
jgi:hypothetical protein